MRFSDVIVGSTVRCYLGGAKVIAKKINTHTLEANKLNSPGTVKIPIHPKLNEDDFELLSHDYTT